MNNELALLNETDLAQVEGGILPLVVAYFGIKLAAGVLIAGTAVCAGLVIGNEIASK